MYPKANSVACDNPVASVGGYNVTIQEPLEWGSSSSDLPSMVASQSLPL